MWKYEDENRNHLPSYRNVCLLRKQHGCFMALNQLETRQARQSKCGAGGRFAFPWQFEHRQALWIRRLRPACGAEWEYSSWILFLDRLSEERQGEETGRGTYTQGNLDGTHSSLSQRCSQLSLSLTHTYTEWMYQARPLADRESIYLNPVQELAHAPEAVSLDVPQHLFLQAGNIEIFHLFLCKEPKDKRK